VAGSRSDKLFSQAYDQGSDIESRFVVLAGCELICIVRRLAIA
jgi:hypothetical protein